MSDLSTHHPRAWLRAPDEAMATDLLDALPGDLPPLRPAAPDEVVDAVAPGECGEALVDLPDGLGHRHCYARLGIASAPATMRLREGVVRRLLAAQAALPEGFSVVVLDGWRTPTFQGDLLGYYRRLTGQALDGYVSDPTSTTRMAPHTTGGAVDLTLAWQGEALAMGTDFDSFDPGAHLLALESLPADAGPRERAARGLRRLLGAVLTDAGLAPYPLEWWHWSYGEQRWAAFVGRDRTEYSPLDG